MYDFLTANAVRGFWFLPPDGGTETFVVVDEWSAEVTERSIANGITGTLQVTFVRSFNPQPAGV
jgi:phage-related protein